MALAGMQLACKTSAAIMNKESSNVLEGGFRCPFSKRSLGRVLTRVSISRGVDVGRRLDNSAAKMVRSLVLSISGGIGHFLSKSSRNRGSARVVRRRS